MMKVLVTGAYSTGKSTLVDAVSASLRKAGLSVEVLSDIARDCPVALNGEQTEAATLWLLNTQIAREIEATQRECEIILCDRGIPDIRAHFEDVATRSDGHLVPSMAPFLDAWMALYDLILLSRVDPSCLIEADGLRVTDEAFRARLDRYAAEGLEGRDNVLELPLGVENRLDYTLEEIRRRLS
jgi:nicotinamide riboside kinase